MASASTSQADPANVPVQGEEPSDRLAAIETTLVALQQAIEGLGANVGNVVEQVSSKLQQHESIVEKFHLDAQRVAAATHEALQRLEMDSDNKESKIQRLFEAAHAAQQRFDNLEGALRSIQATLQQPQLQQQPAAPATPQPVSQSQQDPWAAAAAVNTSASATAPAAGAAFSVPYGPTAPTGGSLAGYSVNPRLDKIDIFDGDKMLFRSWKLKVEVHLTEGREDVRKVLEWAEGQGSSSIDIATEQTAPGHGFTLDARQVSESIYAFLVKTTGHNLMAKKEKINRGAGLEFWRVLNEEFEPSSHKWKMANAQQVIKPTRVTSLSDLSDALDKWEVKLGRSGLNMPEWAKLSGLMDLVPENLCREMEQSTLLVSYDQKLDYVRRVLKDYKANSEAAGVNQADKMAIGSFQMESPKPPEQQTSTSPTSRPEEEWKANEFFQQLASFMKGSKGRGKGGGKGEPSTTKFDGDCNYCGKYGHRQAECRKKTRDMQKGQSAFKGGGKGGKGAWTNSWKKGINAVEEEGGGEWVWKSSAADEQGEQQPPWSICSVGNGIESAKKMPLPPGLKLSSSWGPLEDHQEVLESTEFHQKEFPVLQATGAQKMKAKLTNMCSAKDNNKCHINCCGVNAIWKKTPPTAPVMAVHGKTPPPGFLYKEVLVDSGACESVSARGEFPGHEIEPSPGLRDGVMYTSAGGEEIPNEGQQTISSTATLCFRLLPSRVPSWQCREFVRRAMTSSSGRTARAESFRTLRPASL